MDFPKDPYMLLSIINMKLRDAYSDLDDLCLSEDISRGELEEILHNAGFDYDPATNSFR